MKEKIKMTAHNAFEWIKENKNGLAVTVVLASIAMYATGYFIRAIKY
jgi:hypothetical protein